MDPRIRKCAPADHDAVVALSLRAWRPVFESVNGMLGVELATLLHGEDWREHQERAVRRTLADPSWRVWVAEARGRVAGFAAAGVADPDRLIGEISMVAVDPAQQGRGLGRALIGHATAWLRESGMRVAFVATGGDPGHAPARRLYERAGYRHLPAAQYFKPL